MTLVIGLTAAAVLIGGILFAVTRRPADGDNASNDTEGAHTYAATKLHDVDP